MARKSRPGPRSPRRRRDRFGYRTERHAHVVRRPARRSGVARLREEPGDHLLVALEAPPRRSVPVAVEAPPRRVRRRRRVGLGVAARALVHRLEHERGPEVEVRHFVLLEAVVPPHPLADGRRRRIRRGRARVRREELRQRPEELALRRVADDEELPDVPRSERRAPARRPLDRRQTRYGRRRGGSRRRRGCRVDIPRGGRALGRERRAAASSRRTSKSLLAARPRARRPPRTA